MSKKLTEYKNALNKLKINKFDFLKHKIDKRQVEKSYKDFANAINQGFYESEEQIADFIKYELWLLEDWIGN